MRTKLCTKTQMKGKILKDYSYFLNHSKENQIFERLEGGIPELNRQKSAMPRRVRPSCILPFVPTIDKIGETVMIKKVSSHTNSKDQAMTSLMKSNNTQSVQSILPTIEAICQTLSKRCIQTSIAQLAQFSPHKIIFETDSKKAFREKILKEKEYLIKSQNKLSIIGLIDLKSKSLKIRKKSLQLIKEGLLFFWLGKPSLLKKGWQERKFLKEAP